MKTEVDTKRNKWEFWGSGSNTLYIMFENDSTNMHEKSCKVVENYIKLKACKINNIEIENSNKIYNKTKKCVNLLMLLTPDAKCLYNENIFKMQPLPKKRSKLNKDICW